MTGHRTGRVLVIVPTYNERENLPLIVGRVRSAVPEAHVLVADDASPDGTGQIADGIASDDDHVHVLHRPGKEGLGAAYLDGWIHIPGGVTRRGVSGADVTLKHQVFRAELTCGPPGSTAATEE